MGEDSRHYGKVDRRSFLTSTLTFLGAGAVSVAGSYNLLAKDTSEQEESKINPEIPWRVGAAAYCVEYSNGLFRSRGRSGSRMDAFDFIEMTLKMGETEARLHMSMIKSISDA